LGRAKAGKEDVMDSEFQYIQAVKSALLEEYSSPSVELVLFFANRVCSSIPTQQGIEQLAPLVKEAFDQFINDRTSDRLRTVSRDKEVAENSINKPGHHTISDREFEEFFVVNVN